MVIPTLTVGLRMPVKTWEVIKTKAELSGLTPEMYARKCLCEMFPEKK